MPAPTARRRRHRGPDHTFLPSLASIVDEATNGSSGHVLVRVEGPIHPEVDLGLLPLADGVHPFDELAGHVAPDQWTVFGLRATGRARRLDAPEAAPREMATTFLVDRLGREASVLRCGGEVIDQPGHAEGTIPDLCRRVLGLPTDPAPPTTALLWSAIWLDRILERSGEADERLERFSQLALLHPALDAAPPPQRLTVADPRSLGRLGRAHAAAHPWAALREQDEPLPLPDGPLDPWIARWMDDGFFARWTIGAHPPLAATALDLRARLGDPVGTQLLDALVHLLER